MNINDDAEKLDYILIDFARELFGDAIPFGLDDPEQKEMVERFRNEILEMFS